MAASARTAQSAPRARPATATSQPGAGLRHPVATPWGNPFDLSAPTSLASAFSGSLSTTLTPNMQSSIFSSLGGGAVARPSSTNALHSTRTSAYIGTRPRSSSSLGLGRNVWRAGAGAGAGDASRSKRTNGGRGMRPAYARPATSASHTRARMGAAERSDDGGAGSGHWAQRVQNQNSFIARDGSHGVVHIIYIYVYVCIYI